MLTGSHCIINVPVLFDESGSKCEKLLVFGYRVSQTVRKTAAF